MWSFRSLTSAHVFVGIMLLLWTYFQLDIVSPFVITILLIYTKNTILIIITRDLTPKFVYRGSSIASKFGFCSISTFFSLLARDLNLIHSDSSNKLFSLAQIAQETGLSDTIVLKGSLVISPFPHSILKLHREPL